MPTVYQRFQKYRLLPESIPFGKKKYKTLCVAIKNNWNKNNTESPEYISSEENGIIYEFVRNYPEKFQSIIDTYIWTFHLNTVKYQQENIPKESETIDKKRVRKKKPIFSGKPLIK